MSKKAIILLTLTGLFTYLSWIVFIPFVSELFHLKNERALLIELQSLPLLEKERELVDRESSFIQERFSEGVLQKAKRSMHLLFSLPFFAKLLFALTLLLMLMLLRDLEGAKELLFLLPLTALLLLFTLPENPPSKRALLYPEFPKAAFSSKAEFEKNWTSYLTQEFQGDMRRFQLHLVKGAPLSEEKEKPLIGAYLTLFFLSWSSYSAYQLSRRRTP